MTSLQFKKDLITSFMESPLTPEAKRYIISHQDKLISEGAFDSQLTFGTGGVRNIMGLGTNRINHYTIAKLTYALIHTLQKKKGTFIIGYDSRSNAKELAYITKYILEEHDYSVIIFSQPIPTPLVSFAITMKQALGGIMITASHNPPNHNGYKIYANHGEQITNPQDEQIHKIFLSLPYTCITNKIHEIKPQTLSEQSKDQENGIIQSYIKQLIAEPFVQKGEKKLSILYSPLHGTGGWIFKKVFHALNYRNFHTLKLQYQPDGNFPTVTSPNPEEAAFTELLKHGKESNAQLLLATDPDADRLGCYVYHHNSYVHLTGNQIGSLLLYYMIQTKQEHLKAPFFCNTIVTTDLQEKIAEEHNITIHKSLTGFKYIASHLIQDPKNFLFGAEESLGYLGIPWVRDKDAVSSAVVLAELANQCNLVDTLNDLFIRYGLYHEKLISIALEHSAKNQRFQSLMQNSDRYRNKMIGNRKVVDIIDLQHKKSSLHRPHHKTWQDLFDYLPQAALIQLCLEPEGKIIIRPSGTEAKMKIYINLRHPQQPSQETLKQYKQDIQKEADEMAQQVINMHL